MQNQLVSRINVFYELNIKNRVLIFFICLGFTILGIVFLMNQEDEYESFKRVHVDIQNENTIDAGLSNLAGLGGFQFPGGNGFQLSLFNDIFESYKFKSKVLRIPVNLTSFDENYVFMDMLEVNLKDFDSISEELNSLDSFDKSLILERGDVYSLKKLDKIFKLIIDEESGIITLFTRLPDPFLSSKLCDDVLELMIEEYILIQTKSNYEEIYKTREMLDTIRLKYEIAEVALNTFEENNSNIIDLSLKKEFQRLENTYNNYASSFNTIQSSLISSELQLIQNTPTIITIEHPYVTLKNVNTSFKVGLFASIILGYICSLIFIYSRIFYLEIIK